MSLLHRSARPFLAVMLLCHGCTAARPAPATPASPQVVVVGGGLAGLVSAYALEKQGLRVTLLELSDRLGGKVATAHYGPGLKAEYGMQEIWSKSPLATVAQELGLELTSESSLSSVQLDGKLQAFDEDTDEAYLQSLFSQKELGELEAWMTATRALAAELGAKGLTPALAPLNDVSFATWLQEQRLSDRARQWVRLTLDCELATDADSFSAASGIAELRPFISRDEKARHVVGGNSRLISALAAKLKGEVLTRAKVTRIQRGSSPDGRTRVRVSYLRDNEQHTVEAQRVVLAVPFIMLHLIQLDPPLPPEAWDALMTLGRGQYTVVHLLIDKGAHRLWGGADARPFPVLTPGPLGVIYGVAEPSPPSQPWEVFSLLVHGQPAREFHLAPHEGKRAQLIAELEKLWPGFGGYVRDASVYPYHPSAVPYWPPGRSPFDARAQLLFEDFQGLRLAGDYLVSSHSEGAVIAGQRQAAAIGKELTPLSR